MSGRKKLLPRHLRQHWTDYPITELGDAPYREAPVRPVKPLSYDGDKYFLVDVEGVKKEIKFGYIYTRAGRYGTVPLIHKATKRILEGK
jgi:hypothetical protein